MNPCQAGEHAEWIIQHCLGWRKGTTELIYEDWPEYSQPMTRTAALNALRECDKKYPYEFRAHRLDFVSIAETHLRIIKS